jgi:carboxypeptidase Q
LGRSLRGCERIGLRSLTVAVLCRHCKALNRARQQAVALVLLVLLWPAPASSQTKPLDNLFEDLGRSKTLEKNLRTLCDDIGGRMTGTPAMGRAVTWAVSAFRRAGVPQVHTESFTVPNSWMEEAARGEVLAPVRFSVRLAGVAWGPATAASGLQAEVVAGGRGDEGDITALGTAVRGRIVLVRSETLSTFNDMAVEYRRAVTAIREAERAGAAAVLLLSTRPRGLLYRHITILDGRVAGVPAAVIAREDGLRMLRLLETGRPLRMRLVLRNKIGGPFQAENVVAEIRGREKPDEVVVFGAHLDSWDLGAGCLDNGVNAALAVESARYLQSLQQRPRRTIRFVLFAGEEQGLLGSQAYVAQHRSELDRFAAVVVHDIGSGPIYGYSLGGRREIEDAVRESLSPVAYRGVNSHTSDAFFGTDHFDFLLEGVPTLVANQDTRDYVANYHAESDTFDKVDLEELRIQTVIATALLYNLADRPARPGRRLTRAEVNNLLEDTRLDDQLKFLGLWEQWTSGARGRRP